MSQIEVSVYDQTAYFNHTPDIFSGDIGTDTVKFTFDSTWNNFDVKTVVFYNEPKKSYPVILDTNNVATIPKTVINRECALYFGVMGTNESGDVKTSSILSYRIARGAISADTEVLSPSTDVWLQILANYEIALNQVADMNNRLNIMENRVIESAQENKANINLNNINNEGINKLLSVVNMDTISNGETYSKHIIKCGTVETNSTGIGTVTFDTPFNSVPVVVVTGVTLDGQKFAVASLVSVSESGFTVRFTDYQLNVSAGTVHWIAMVV